MLGHLYTLFDLMKTDIQCAVRMVVVVVMLRLKVVRVVMLRVVVL